MRATPLECQRTSFLQKVVLCVWFSVFRTKVQLKMSTIIRTLLEHILMRTMYSNKFLIIVNILTTPDWKDSTKLNAKCIFLQKHFLCHSDGAIRIIPCYGDVGHQVLMEVELQLSCCYLSRYWSSQRSNCSCRLMKCRCRQ